MEVKDYGNRCIVDLGLEGRMEDNYIGKCWGVYFCECEVYMLLMCLKIGV